MANPQQQPRQQNQQPPVQAAGKQGQAQKPSQPRRHDGERDVRNNESSDQKPSRSDNENIEREADE